MSKFDGMHRFSMNWKEQLKHLFKSRDVNESAVSYCQIFGFDENNILNGLVPLPKDNPNLPPNLKQIYHDEDRKTPPIAIIYDPSIDKKVNPAKTYFYKLQRYDRACSTVGQTKPEIYALIGKKKVVWTSVTRGKPERFEVSLRPGQITSGVERKLLKLRPEHIKFADDIILGRYPIYSFLFEHIELDKEFVELLDELKINLVRAMITNKLVIELIERKFNLSNFEKIDITEQEYFHNIIIAVADTIILRTLLEKYIEVNFEGIDEKLEMKINELKSKINLKIGKDIEKETLKILREGTMQTVTSHLQIDDSYMETMKEKDRLYKEYQGGDFFNSVISSVITEVIQILGRNYSALIQSLISSGRYNFRYEDLSIDILQEFYERSLHKVIQINVDNNGKKQVSVNNSSDAQKKAGAFFTPFELCDKMIALSLQQYVNKQIQTPIRKKLEELENTTTRKTIFQEIESLIKKLLDIRICDPSIGAGVFLRSAFHSLSNLFTPITELINDLVQQYPAPMKDILGRLDAKYLWNNTSHPENQSQWEEYILKNMLYGVDLDIRAVYISSQVLTLSSLRMIRHGQHFPTFVNLNLKQGNALISPILLSAVENKMLSEEYGDIIREIIKIRREAKITREYKQIQDMLTKTAELTSAITQTLILRRLVKVWKGRDEKVFTREELLDRRLMPFIWQLEFPEIFFDENGVPIDNPGFTLVVGNPPWEVWKPHKKEWLSTYESTKGMRSPREKIEILLREKPELQFDYDRYKKFYKAPSKFFRERYKLQDGEVDLYQLFMELFYNLSHNMYAYVVPGSLSSSKGGQKLREMMINDSKVICFLELISSENTGETRSFFSSITPGTSILVAVLEKNKTTDIIMFKTNISKVPQLNFSEDVILYDINEGKSLESIAKKYGIVLFTREEITRYSRGFIIPVFHDPQDALLLRKMYKHQILGGDVWNCKTSRGLDMSKLQNLNSVKSDSLSTPVIRGRDMMRFGYSLKKPEYRLSKKGESRFKLFGTKFIAWRRVSKRKDRRMMKVIFVKESERIVIAASIAAISELPEGSYEYVCGIMNSIPFEFRIRQILSSSTIAQYIIEDMPIPLFSSENKLHMYLSEKAISFRKIADEWADEKVTAEGNVNMIDQEGELRYKKDLSEFDAISALIYDLNLGEFKQTLRAHKDVASEYKREAVKQYIKLIEQFKLGNTYRIDDTNIEF